ncbi:inactive ubiquitin carboxyl-terminal hydrolase 54-like [Limulus polyphemus]|uniref:Inactive ubiquitin carboxyl-terminal hydrolase 54-like n=1 Tax=Limulus polyphemus TaxID=6850 RepID=A0ABM1SAC9_LIMPO|nr:inactive ubiquitin carboxyl-terminal hydrolase 54-like [Limulus polyphemus]
MAPVPTPSPAQVLTPKITELQMKQLMNQRDSMSMDYYKGLLNMPGQNNCFLNSAVQVLWHLDIFRRSFRELSGHTCMAECCIFCALKELFAQLQYSQESALPPDALRHALAETFHQRRFQLGGMDDAAECFENILRQIHFHIANQESEDMCNSPHCIPHQKFAMTLVEQAICHACGATSEPLSFTQMVHYVSTSALCSQAEFVTNQHKDPADSFGHILRKAGGMGDTRDCPSACGAKIQICRILMNHPEILSVGLVWDSERPSIQHILEVFKSIGMVLKIQEMFHSVVDNQWARNTTHHLVGIVTYYGKHYSTFFFHTKLGIWIYFDDATVHEIGPKWEQVIEKCRRGHFQPLLLLYANKNGSPVSGSTAPKSITMVAKNQKSLKGSDQFHTGGIVSEAGTSICNTVSDNYQRKMLILCQEYPYENSGSIQTKRSHKSNESNFKSNPINPTLLHSNQCTMYPSQNLIMSGYCSNESGQQHLHQNFLSPLKCESGVSYCFSPENATGQQDFSQWTSNHSSSHTSCVADSQSSVPSSHYVNNTSNQLTSDSFTSEPKLNDNINKSNCWIQSCGFQPHYHPTADESPNVSNFRDFSPNKETTSQQACGLGSAGENTIDCKTYINRKAVESVLNAQKLKRQRSLNENYNSATGNRHSASSLESFDNNIQTRNALNKMPNLKGELSGTANVLWRRDSGNWSGDCNSGSSSSGTSFDTLYIYGIGSKKLTTNKAIGHQNAPDNTRSCQHNYINVGILPDQGYDSFSLSSTDSYPSVPGSPASSDLRLTQIPEDLQTKFQVTRSLKSADSESQHLSGLKSKMKASREDCDKLCAEADLLLKKSHEKEKEGDLVMAAMLSDSAAAKARAAMDAPYNNIQSFISAKMKHSFCVMRSSSLHKRLNEPEMEERKKQKDVSILEGHHSRQSNRGSRQRSKDDWHSQQGSKHSSSINKNMDAFDLNAERTIEIYATLPKRGSKHKHSPKSKDEKQVHRDFAEKQKQTLKAEVINQVTDQMTVISQINNRESLSKDL